MKELVIKSVYSPRMTITKCAELPRRLNFRLAELQEEGFQKCDRPVKVVVFSKICPKEVKC
jgi:hypothetical protein